MTEEAENFVNRLLKRNSGNWVVLLYDKVWVDLGILRASDTIDVVRNEFIYRTYLRSPDNEAKTRQIMTLLEKEGVIKYVKLDSCRTVKDYVETAPKILPY